MPVTSPASPSLKIQTYFGCDFKVVDGAALNDPLSFADELMLDDIYCLIPGTPLRRVEICLGQRLRTFRICEGSQCGTPGHALHLDSCLTLMAPDGATLEILIMVEVEDHAAAQVFAVPLGPVVADREYRLIAIDRHAATRRMAQIGSASFAAGTRITMADGTLRPIDRIAPGDMVLTRDSGPQPVRWIGHTTVRAQGYFAPVTIAPGVFNNPGPLVLNADHRILVYQRGAQITPGQAEALVKVRHLIDGDAVTQREGGFVDYYQILLDAHEIIYAEGIAAESLMLDARDRQDLPADLQSRLVNRPATQRPSYGYELAGTLLSRPDALALLRRASGM